MSFIPEMAKLTVITPVFNVTCSLIFNIFERLAVWRCGSAEPMSGLNLLA